MVASAGWDVTGSGPLIMSDERLAMTFGRVCARARGQISPDRLGRFYVRERWTSLTAVVPTPGSQREPLICGPGAAMSDAAIRHQGIKAGSCRELATVRRYRRLHHTADPARLAGEGVAKNVLRIFETIDFRGGRRQSRVAEQG